MSELVSVIIPTYKRADMLDRAINSVLNQSYKDVEVVVVDDNDPDSEWRKRTELKMEKYSENERVQYIKHEKNMNGSVARNTGISKSNGSIIAFLDDDDEYLPLKIEKQVNYLKTHHEYQAVYCGWTRDGNTVIPTLEGDLRIEILSGRNLIYTNVIMMWKKCAIDFGGWDVTFKRHQEAAFLMRFFENGGKIGVVSENLVKFDISDRSNEAGNSIIYHEQMDHYLNTFAYAIDECDSEIVGAKKFILCNRYRGVLFAHIKNGNIVLAAKLYIQMTLKYPFSFNSNILQYVFWRLGKNRKNVL